MCALAYCDNGACLRLIHPADVIREDARGIDNGRSFQLQLPPVSLSSASTPVIRPFCFVSCVTGA